MSERENDERENDVSNPKNLVGSPTKNGVDHQHHATGQKKWGPSTIDEDGWTKVEHRRKKDLSGGRKLVNKWTGSVSYFVYNLPEDCSSSMLWNSFKPFGGLVDAYVARKKDKYDGRFGFIRFIDVKDKVWFLRDLNKVIIGGAKLGVKLPLFDREGNRLTYEHVGSDDGNGLGKSNLHPPTCSVAQSVANGLRCGSYRDAVLPRSGLENKLIEIVIKSSDVSETGEDLRSCSLLGSCRDVKKLERIMDLLSLLKLGEIYLRYAGGLKVLLTFVNPGGAAILLRNQEVWSEWFVSLEHWKEHTLVFERVAWLRIMGIPPHLWCHSTSNNIAARFGEVVEPSTVGANDGNLAVDMVAVRVTHGNFINDRCRIKWNEMEYVVWVMEDTRLWVPKCLESKGPQDGSFGSESGSGVMGSSSDKSEDNNDDLADESPATGSDGIHTTGDLQIIGGQKMHVHVDGQKDGDKDIPREEMGDSNMERESEKAAKIKEQKDRYKKQLQDNILMQVGEGYEDETNFSQTRQMRMNPMESNCVGSEDKEISHIGETSEDASCEEAMIVESQEIRLNENIALETAVNEDLFGLDPIINMINAQEKEMGETTNMGVPSIDGDSEIRASVPDLNHSYHSTSSNHSEHSMLSVESSAKEDEAEIMIDQIIPPISGVSSDLRNPPPPMPMQADNSQINRKGQKKVSKKASKKRNDMNWTSFIGGISSPEEHAAGAVTRTTNKSAIEMETQETVRVGELIGINLKGYEDQIQALIREEGVNPFLA